MGWLTDVNAQGQDYALTGTFLWLGVIAGEPLVNQLIRKLPVAKVLGYSMVAWSGVSAISDLSSVYLRSTIFAVRLRMRTPC